MVALNAPIFLIAQGVRTLCLPMIRQAHRDQFTQFGRHVDTETQGQLRRFGHMLDQHCGHAGRQKDVTTGESLYGESCSDGHCEGIHGEPEGDEHDGRETHTPRNVASRTVRVK